MTMQFTSAFQLMIRHRLRNSSLLLCALALVLIPLATTLVAQSQPEHLIEVVADRDSRYKIVGQDKPVITVTAGELVRLRITAIKAKNHARDGSVHGFTLLRASDHVAIPEWDFLLKPGLQEFVLNAPEEPGEYLVVCTVICSANHEQMTMKFIVEPRAK